MIKLTKFRRSGLWLLSFIAALLTLSPSANADYGKANFMAWHDGSQVLNQDVSTTNGNYFAYFFKPTASGDYYFRLRDNEHNKYIGAPNDDTPMTFNNGKAEYNECFESEKSFKLSLDKDKSYLIEYWYSYNNTGKHRIQISSDPFRLVGEWGGKNDWSTGILPTSGGDGFVQFDIEPTSDAHIKFRIKFNGDEYYPNNGDTHLSNNASKWEGAKLNGSGCFFIDNATSNYKYTIKFGTGNKDVNATWTEKQSGGGGGNNDDPTYTNDVQIFGNFEDVGFTPYEGWTNWSSMQGTLTEDNNEYYYTFSPTKEGRAYFRVKIGNTTYKPNSGDTYCEENNWDHDNAKAYSYTGNTNDCWYVDVYDANKIYTIVIHKKHNNNSGDVRVNRRVEDKPYGGMVLPVYPKGVTNKAGLAAYNDWPIYYLQAYELNNYRVTPEYQMKKRADGKYELRVNMHQTGKVYVEKFENATDNSTVNTPISFTPTFEPGTYTGAGRSYLAVYDPASGNLSFEDPGVAMPFISMIGKDWKQNTVANENKPYVTPFPFEDSGETDSDAENRHYYQKGRDTDFGWQEAWIQYSNGQMLKDRQGKVMYTTLWPQDASSEVKFKTSFTAGGKRYDDFTLSSKQLTFVPQNGGVAKKGSEWKNDPRFAELSNSNPISDFSGTEYSNMLVLDDNAYYVLYTVNGMWINGDVKLWTGWGGVATGGGRFDSKWFANWGHYNKSTSATKISAGSTVPLGDANGDMKFEKPTYFKSVNFFLNTSNPTTGSMLFTELALGGGEISAMARENYTMGMYSPRLTKTDGIESAKIKSVKITSLDHNDGSVVATVFNKTYTNKTVADWNSLFTYGESGSDGTSWVYDTFKYSNGDYRYKMVVVIEDVNGHKNTIDVESNPFTVFKGEASAEIKGYQLVKRQKPSEDGLGNPTYNYLTYSSDPEDKAYLVKIILTKPTDANTSIENADEYDKDAYIDVNWMPKEIADDAVNYGDGSLYRFSCKLLLVGDIVGVNVSNPELTSNLFEGSAIEENTIYKLTNNNTRFFAVTEPTFVENYDKDGKIDLDNCSGFNYDYSWTPKFKYDFEDAEGNSHTKSDASSTASYTGCLVVPEPRLISEESQIEMFYGSDTDDKTNDATLSGITYNVNDNIEGVTNNLGAVTLGAYDNTGGARYQQLRTAIVIERPNVTRRFSKLASDYLIAEAEREGLKVSYKESDKEVAPLIEAMFDFYLVEQTQSAPYNVADQIGLKNGLSYSDNKNPNWYVYYTPTRQPSYLYFNIDAADAETLGNPSVNIGVNNYFAPKKMTAVPRAAFSELTRYPRWTDGEVHGIRIQQDKPDNKFDKNYSWNDAIQNNKNVAVGASKDENNDVDNNIRIVGRVLSYNSDNNLIETLKIRINFESNTENRLYRVDSEGAPKGYQDATNPGKALQYSSASNDDYFYIRITDENNNDIEQAHTVSAANLANGYEISISKNYGHWYEEQVDDVNADPWANKINVKISHLYPFVYGENVNDITVGQNTPTTQTAPKRAMRKAGEDSNTPSTEVVKSDAITRSFSLNGEVVTSVIGLEEVLSNSVVAGVGYIEVHGEGVEIYGADGVKVATGEGRHEVAAGVYVVRLNGRAEKVIVR